MKTWFWWLHNHFLLRNTARLLCTVVNSLTDEFQNKKFTFRCFEPFSKKACPVRHGGWFQYCWHLCAGWNIARATLVCVFVAMRENMFERNVVLEFFCHIHAGLHRCRCLLLKVNVIHARGCVVLICCQTPTCWNVHSKNHVDRNYFRAKYFRIWRHSKLNVCYKTQRLLCTAVEGLRSELSEQDVYVSLGFIFHWKMHILFVTIDAVSAGVMLAVGCNIAQSSLYWLFVVMSNIMFEKMDGLKISVKCLWRLHGCRCLVQSIKWNFHTHV
jgi:hypothetical protein